MKLVTLGDSLAYGAGDERDGGISGRIETELRKRGVAGVDATNLGQNGAQTADVLYRIRQERVRKLLGTADAIILSIGANDLFRTPGSREQVLADPFSIADKILGRIEQIITELRTINPRARILLLGGYNPVPSHAFSMMVDHYLALWDDAVTTRFAKHPLVSIVKMADLVTANRLSRYDNFHPGATAYDAISKRVAEMLVAKAD
ncbi:MAG TPA: GDSL-type esterase/lipase family protein [Thermoanaerobaculia bacterium]|jgi:lysophospholipase L1-like esterase